MVWGCGWGRWGGGRSGARDGGVGDGGSVGERGQGWVWGGGEELHVLQLDVTDHEQIQQAHQYICSHVGETGEVLSGYLKELQSSDMIV